MSEATYDVAIAGGGAAGLSAALVLGRARRRVLLVDAGTPRNAPAAHMHGYLSRDGMPPDELLAAGREEARGYGVELAGDRVLEVTPGFTLLLTSGRRVEARRVVVATGATDDLPDVSGARERWGRDLLHCPYCHGWEVRDEPLGVLGTGPVAVPYAQIVRQWSDDVVLLAHRYTPSSPERAELEARGIAVVDGLVARLVVEDDRLTGVQLADGRIVPRAAVFAPPAVRPHANGLLESLGCAVDDAGFVSVDGTGKTSVPGVWAVGNAANPRAQVITAAGEGSAAAIALNADLVGEDVRDAVERPAKNR